MSAGVGSIEEMLAALDERSRTIVDCLRELSTDELLYRSELPEWSRLTIVCHLRFGAEALSRMTRCAIRDQPASYYPEGRDRRRPQTLVPQPGESPQQVVESLARANDDLEAQWSSLPSREWEREVIEPPTNVDLGPLPLSALPLLRLTEVEVHGGDLGLHLVDWSPIFVQTVLPMRFERLNVHRVNHRAYDGQLVGSWLLVATDGPTYKVEVDGKKVVARPARPDSPSRAVIQGTSRDLLALLLGRTLQHRPVISGDTAFARSFSRAFPGP